MVGYIPFYPSFVDYLLDEGKLKNKYDILKLAGEKFIF
jgi:hypothetical protein